MKNKTIYLLGLATILMIGLTASVRAEQTVAEVKTVPSVNVDRYVGKWYEIAKYPNRFQKKCIANTTATYTKKADGRLEVLNSCRTENGETDEAKGEAKIVDKNTNARLKVRFAPGFLSLLPFVWGDYWVIDLDREYKYAVVGTPSRDYLWILSRTPELDENTYQGIISRIKEQGFDPNRLVKTPQRK
jgi:apolipoprotein D and lipocalin family protein